MSTRFTLTGAEQDELRQCPHVASCTARTVQFTPVFKRFALVEYARGKMPDMVFREAGIPGFLLKPRYAKGLLRGWRVIAHKHGDAGFDEEHRGRQGVVALAKWRDRKEAYVAMSDKEKVAFLEAQVEALEHVRAHFQLPLSIHFGTHGSRQRKNARSFPA